MSREAIEHAALTVARKRTESNQPSENTDITGWSHYLAHLDTNIEEALGCSHE